ncbi:MAG: M20/M25/M40 family metallo-hydrolase [Pseudomonadota bacterium]
MTHNAANAAPTEYVAQEWQQSVMPTLHDYIRIPNKSPMFDPEWEQRGEMQRAAELLFTWASARQINGMQISIEQLPGRTPVLFIEIAASGDTTQTSSEAATVLLYGHYDKQPEFDGWHAGLSPWEPVERDGKLYGRGGADDGYALFASLLSIEAIQQQGGHHPRCVVLIEGCEESGSFDLPFYVDHLRGRIGQAKLVICLDAECGNYDQLWVTTSLRGMLPGVLSVDILTEGQHSGSAGGIVPSSFRILRDLLGRIENSASGALHPSLHTDIPTAAINAAQEVAQVLGPQISQRFPWTDGAGPDQDDMAQLLISNAWEPSLATVALGGFPDMQDAGNTLRPGTQAKLVFRLPPTVDADLAATEIKAILEQDPPYGARVQFSLETPQTGWCAPIMADWLEHALQQASLNAFGKPAMQMGMGGTIPFMKMLGDAYPSTQFFVTGVLGPQSNAHGPNEFLHIETAKRLTCIVSEVLQATYRQWRDAE